MARVMLPLTATLSGSVTLTRAITLSGTVTDIVAVKIVIPVKVIVVIDVDVAPVPVAITPMTSPITAPGNGRAKG